MNQDFSPSMFECAGCDTMRPINAAGFCAECASPEGVTITPPRGPSLLDAAKFMRKTLTDEADDLGLPSESVLTAMLVLSAAIHETELMRGDHE